jgi:hypothetical protein
MIFLANIAERCPVLKSIVVAEILVSQVSLMFAMSFCTWDESYIYLRSPCVTRIASWKSIKGSQVKAARCHSCIETYRSTYVRKVRSLLECQGERSAPLWALHVGSSPMDAHGGYTFSSFQSRNIRAVTATDSRMTLLSTTDICTLRYRVVT